MDKYMVKYNHNDGLHILQSIGCGGLKAVAEKHICSERTVVCSLRPALAHMTASSG